MKQINFILLSLFFFSAASAQMYVHDPQSWWGETPAYLENVEFEVRPAGVYAEVSVAFDLLSEPDFWPTDEEIQLEFVWDFNLDEEAVFNDSWLWIEDYISYGEIYESNQGTAIYEAIVDRRQDPSILTKTSSNGYNFRVYPLLPDSSRRVKLSYLVPMDFKERNPQLKLGFEELLKDAGNGSEVEQVSITVHDGLNWFHKPITGMVSEMGSGSVKYLIEDNSLLRSFDLQFQADDPQADVYFGTYESGGEQFYQLVYYPDIEVETEPSYNLILLDYDAESTAYDKNEFVSEVGAQLKALNETDFFTIVYSDFVVRFSSDEWQPATSENINVAIQKVIDGGIDTQSKLEALIPNSLNFIEEKETQAVLHLITSNTEYYRQDLSDAFLYPIMDYVAEMNVDFEIRVNDYADRNRPSRWIDNVRYTGSEYFLKSLVSRVGGQYLGFVQGEDLTAGLEQLLDPSYVLLKEFDLDLDPKDGLTYSNYYTNGGAAGIRLDQPVIANGKMIGEFPIELDMKALNNGELLSEKIVITENNMTLNSMAPSTWSAEFLLANENETDAQTQAEVLDMSIEERLLCSQTVFLCLEADTSAISSANQDEEGEVFVSTDDLNAEEVSITAYPNPFINELKISLPENLRGQEVILEFTDLRGMLIDQTRLSQLETKSEILYRFEQMAQLASGMYLVRIIIGEKSYNLKVMRIEN